MCCYLYCGCGTRINRVAWWLWLGTTLAWPLLLCAVYSKLKSFECSASLHECLEALRSHAQAAPDSAPAMQSLPVGGADYVHMQGQGGGPGLGAGAIPTPGEGGEGGGGIGGGEGGGFAWEFSADGGGDGGASEGIMRALQACVAGVRAGCWDDSHLALVQAALACFLVSCVPCWFFMLFGGCFRRDEPRRGGDTPVAETKKAR
ncbi:hypothetical protein FOA52_001398 [Chlamydomonas sp. UWO 241]|nr:hypothetical protein FOA52_001398 [Chlamydomonas sp. UWO 241]